MPSKASPDVSNPQASPAQHGSTKSGPTAADLHILTPQACVCGVWLMPGIMIGGLAPPVPASGTTWLPPRPVMPAVGPLPPRTEALPLAAAPLALPPWPALLGLSPDESVWPQAATAKAGANNQGKTLMRWRQLFMRRSLLNTAHSASAARRR